MKNIKKKKKKQRKRKKRKIKKISDDDENNIKKTQYENRKINDSIRNTFETKVLAEPILKICAKIENNFYSLSLVYLVCFECICIIY